jgi:hypothetical protein
MFLRFLTWILQLAGTTDIIRRKSHGRPAQVLLSLDAQGIPKVKMIFSPAAISFLCTGRATPKLPEPSEGDLGEDFFLTPGI